MNLRKRVWDMYEYMFNKIMNVEDDRLSSLPDELIHKILSSISIKQVVQMSVLSSRWRFIWTSMPYFNLSRDDFSKLPHIWKFIKLVLLLRVNQTELSHVNLSFHGENSDFYIKQITRFVFSHNIQQLNVACLLQNNHLEFTDFVFSSQSLKHLSVTMENFSPYLTRTSSSLKLRATSTFELPALTTLYLHHVTLCCDENTNKCVDFFSKFANLKNLTLKGCAIKGFKGLSIHHPLLSNLTVEHIYRSEEVVNIVTPQLKTLTIRSCFMQHQYSVFAPDLNCLLYYGYFCLQLSTDGFLSLVKADICVSMSTEARQIVRLFQQLRNVKCLALNLEIVELLSSFRELISNQPSPFANLKSLKINPDFQLFELRNYERLRMPAEVKSYLLNRSPNATFTMVTHEDISDIKNTKMAEHLITELRELVERPKPRVNNHNNWHMHQCIDRCSEFVSLRIEKRKEKAFYVISKLKEMKDLLGKLPPSNTAIVVMNKITDFLKMKCDENRKSLIA